MKTYSIQDRSAIAKRNPGSAARILTYFLRHDGTMKVDPDGREYYAGLAKARAKLIPSYDHYAPASPAVLAALESNEIWGDEAVAYLLAPGQPVKAFVRVLTAYGK